MNFLINTTKIKRRVGKLAGNFPKNHNALVFNKLKIKITSNPLRIYIHDDYNSVRKVTTYNIKTKTT
ncbi:hypothetical protein C1H87_08375 [Flavivirga eckloniae]|uniref:Uncharacterized protein n=1 Tax=Flavivirga eckloniae TaxID=1803846 RepID=A0A2K9PNS5_9FLAO|nr:hypothetical protein C1H87_08375 [Flavivirga eckloniae]